MALAFCFLDSGNITGGKGGLVNIVQHFCTSVEFWQHNLIGTILIAPLQTFLAYQSPASDFKGLAFSKINSNS